MSIAVYLLHGLCTSLQLTLFSAMSARWTVCKHTSAWRRSELIEGNDVNGLDVLALAVAHELLLNDGVHRLHLGVLDDAGDLQLLDAEADGHQLRRAPQETVLLDGADLRLQVCQVCIAEETE